MVYYPEINSGVIALSNNDAFSTGVIYPISDLFFKDQFNEEEQKESEDSEATKVAVKTLKQYAGKYKAGDLGLIIEYKLEGGNLFAYVTGQSAKKLTPTSDSTFTYNGVDASVLFHLINDNKSDEAVHTQGGSDLMMKKVASVRPCAK